MNTLKQLTLPFFLLFMIAGCATTSRPVVDMTWYNKPTPATAGMYFFQAKRLLDCDASFTLDGKTLGKINKCEWVYFEVPAGKHKYLAVGGIFPQSIEVDFVAGQNYFFQGSYGQFTNYVLLLKSEMQIKRAIANIESGRYKQVNADDFFNKPKEN